MNINYSYTKEFEEVFNRLKQDAKYKELANLDGIGDQVDMVKFSKKFFTKGKNPTADASVDSNSNVDDDSVIAYNVESAKPSQRLNAYYLLYKYGWKLYGKEVAEKMVRSQFYKEFYINDFHTFGLFSYCFNYSCMDIVAQGLPFVTKIKSEPPKHLSSFMGQMVQFVTYASNSIAGAVGLADFIPCMSWYVKKLYDENKNVPKEFLDKQVKQELQSFLYSVNQPFRGGLQSAFTNLSLYDDNFLDKLCNEYVFPDGSSLDKDLVKELQVVYMDLYNETLRKTPFTFPVTTACFSVDESRNVLDKKFMSLVMEKNKEFGFMNIFAGRTSVLSSCCRLRSDTNNEYFNSFGAGGTKIGSCSVTTLNLPRLAYMSSNKEDFLTKVAEYADMAFKVNQTKRYVVNKRVKNRNLPLYTLGFMDLSKQYNTCGINGVNEALDILGFDILADDSIKFVKDIISTVNTVNDKLSKEYKVPANCEQTPSENSAIKLATADRIMGYNSEYELYSNQFIPLIVKADVLDRIKLQGEFDDLMTGGSSLHVNLAERIEDTNKLSDFVQHIIKQGVIYCSLNYNIQVCEQGHVGVGKKETCDICGAKITDNYTRTVGFLTNTKKWHKVRREIDYPQRQFYKI